MEETKDTWNRPVKENDKSTTTERENITKSQAQNDNTELDGQ